MQMETHGVHVVGRGLQSRLVVVAVRAGQQVLASLHCGGVPALVLHVVLGGALACDVHLCTGTEYRVQVNVFCPLSNIGGIAVFCFCFVFIAKDLQLFLLFLTLHFLSIFVSLSLSVSDSLCLCFCLCLCLSICLPLSLCLAPSVSVCLSLSLHLCL